MTADVLEALIAAVQVIALALITAWTHETKGRVADNADKLDNLNGGKR